MVNASIDLTGVLFLKHGVASWGVKYKHISWFIIISPYFYSLMVDWWANGR